MYHRVDLADGHHLPYPDGTFATIFTNSVLEHIRDVGHVLQEMGRILRAKGRLVATVPSDAFRHFLDGYAQRMAVGDAEGAERYAAAVDARLEHYHYHTPREWQRLLATAGMTLIKARYYIPIEVERLWDRMNRRYGIGRRSAWQALVSPHLRPLGYQALVRRAVVRSLSKRWRPFYEMDVPPGKKGGGLIIVARRED